MWNIVQICANHIIFLLFFLQKLKRKLKREGQGQSGGEIAAPNVYVQQSWGETQCLFAALVMSKKGASLQCVYIVSILHVFNIF